MCQMYQYKDVLVTNIGISPNIVYWSGSLIKFIGNVDTIPFFFFFFTFYFIVYLKVRGKIKVIKATLCNS